MSIARATILLLALALLSRVLGLVREMVIAWRFGASAETDAFFVAFSLPYAFYAVVGGSLTAVIVPLLAEYEARGQHEEAMRTASLVINTVILAIGVLAMLGMIGAPQIAWLLGGGFDAPTLQRAAQFTTLMMPSIIFMSVAGVLAGILNHRHVFGPPAFGPVTMNVIIILGAVVGGAWAGIEGLVAGTVLGAIAFMAVQLPALRRAGFRHRWTFSLKDPAVKRIAGMLWPVILVSGLGFFYTVIDFRLASGLAEGSVTALNYATKLIQLPQGLFVMAVTTAIFPSLSKLAANARPEEMAALLRKGLRIILLLAVPATAGFVVIGQLLIELLFQRGAFGPEATNMTSSALFFLSIGLVGFCLNLPLIRCFHALSDRRTPLLVGMISVTIKLMLSLVFVETMQHSGLALATSLTISLNVVVLAVLLQRRLPNLYDDTFLLFVRNIAIVACVTGGVVYVFDGYLIALAGQAGVVTVLRLLADILVGIIVFTLGTYIARVNEVGSLLSRMVMVAKTVFRRE